MVAATGVPLHLCIATKSGAPPPRSWDRCLPNHIWLICASPSARALLDHCPGGARVGVAHDRGTLVLGVHAGKTCTTVAAGGHVKNGIPGPVADTAGPRGAPPPMGGRRPLC